MNRSVRLLALALMAALPAAAQNPPAADAVVARVNGTPITEVAFLRALAQATATGAPDTPELRNVVRAQLVARELFLQEARKQKIAEDSKVKQAVIEARDNAMVEVFLLRTVKARSIGEDDVRKQYEVV